MMAEVEAEMAAQLAQLHEMEQNGELALSTEVSAPTGHASP